MTPTEHLPPENLFTHEEIQQWNERFKKAEYWLKRVQDETDEGLSFPAVNQLRYAAFHLFSALTAPTDDKRQEQKRKLKSHLDRAVYDACEGIVLYYLNKIREFREDYKTIIITEVLPDYVADARSVESMKVRVETMRGEKEKETFSDEMVEIADTLKTIHEKFNSSPVREELNKQIKQARKRALFYICSAAFAGAAATTGIITLIYQILK